MCDLFGLSCNEKDRATKSLSIFRRKGNNPHGWGIAYYEGNKVKIVKKPEEAISSSEFSEIAEKAKSNTIVAHTRYKTKGTVCERNCHPFTQNFMNKNWIFAHNGHVSGIPHPEDETDSESAFNFLLNKIEEYQTTGQIKGVYPGIVNGIKEIFRTFGKNINLNFLMSDGDILYVFHHYPEKPIYFLRREKDYGGACLVSTQKLSDENWLVLPSDRLLLLNKGEILVLSDVI